MNFLKKLTNNFFLRKVLTSTVLKVTCNHMFYYFSFSSFFFFFKCPNSDKIKRFHVKNHKKKQNGRDFVNYVLTRRERQGCYIATSTELRGDLNKETIIFRFFFLAWYFRHKNEKLNLIHKLYIVTFSSSSISYLNRNKVDF